MQLFGWPRVVAHMDDEQALVERARIDPAAFGQLYDQTYGAISNYILRRVGDVATAQDLTAEVYLKAMQGLSRYQWRGLPFTAWLYRIAANEIASYFRGRRHTNLSLDELRDDYQFEPAATLDLERDLVEAQYQACRQADFRLIQRLLSQLPPKYQEVLALRYFEKKSLADIALITGKNLNTVKSLSARGLGCLRRAYIDAQSHSTLQPSARQPVMKVEE